MNNMDDANNRAIRAARKFTLQNRSVGKKKKIKFIELLQKNITFLDLEASLAVWAEIEKNHISRPTPYNGFVCYDVQNKFVSYLESIEKTLMHFGGSNGFCFTSDWKSTGTAVLDTLDVSRDLDKLLFSHNDSISFFNAELTKAILLSGDRTGTGDKLNELSVSVLGADWIEIWKREVVQDKAKPESGPRSG